MSITTPAISASAGECTSVVTGIFNSAPIAARMSHPSSTPMPRYDRTEVRFALSYDALKINGTRSALQISEIFRAIRQTNFSDSITHGPRMNAGIAPAMVTERILSDFDFTGTDDQSKRHLTQRAQTITKAAL